MGFGEGSSLPLISVKVRHFVQHSAIGGIGFPTHLHIQRVQIFTSLPELLCIQQKTQLHAMPEPATRAPD
jgi:hypothetical protein